MTNQIWVDSCLYISVQQPNIAKITFGTVEMVPPTAEELQLPDKRKRPGLRVIQHPTLAMPLSALKQLLDNIDNLKKNPQLAAQLETTDSPPEMHTASTVTD
ncbi:hypothetical protein [Aestuariispira insulae]|uniref:Uncharacterized protein n=1 Tax=Aestuariispira insulae TaxID=1461337 RepID=A0A3D9H3B8_9PROT|nr:hypothetical protein [Aestuariispira insulae]RED43386.1 hypothetical protein DFP90_1225 [Aestuariispira insulae]